MSILQRYFTSQILKSVFFVLLAFLALFAFFDLVTEINAVGRGAYRLRHAFVFVLLNVPGYIYELMPVAVLIGTIYVLARFAANSEFTIMRASSLSTLQAAWILIRIGAIFMLLTAAVGELVTPYTATMASEFRDSKLLRDRKMQGKGVAGIWSKDSIYSNGLEGEVIGSRFIHIGGLRTDKTIRAIRLFEFDMSQHLRRIILAAEGHYSGKNEWELRNVTVKTLTVPGKPSETRFPASAPELKTTTTNTFSLLTELTPDLLSVLAVDATKMSAYDLALYNRHMEANSQDASAYKIAFWKKIVYPFSVFVMIALALPFAYLHFRSGGISVKIFSGIMIGVLFMLLNSLFSHLGLLNAWSAFLTAVLPSIFFLLCACGALWWVERR
ncbi:MAG: LPS export ABC transporter permease LptG [Burkholderiaceae bacterium]|jgi:lipopolysaccharide export system permease protein|nr:LPS export ABC transporter permease LptG [Burkholderiaceae bacterium]